MTQGFQKERCCEDCGKKVRMLIYWKGKDRCEECDDRINKEEYFGRYSK